MSDRYIDFANSDLGRRLVGAVGLPSPARLERWEAGRLRPVEGALLLGGGPLANKIEAFAKRLTDDLYSFASPDLSATEWVAGLGPKLKAVVFDASELDDSDKLKQLREFFQPLLRSLAPSAHVVILGRAPEQIDDPMARVTQRALEGFSRSLAKELRAGGTLQLLYVSDAAEDQLEGALRFFLSPKSAFISGQVLRLEACASNVQDWTRPLAGRRALVTGAARGIGAAIAETLARDGAEVVLLDVPQAKADLEALAARLGAHSLALDICAADAPAQLIEGLPDGVDIVVHNAGITRDKLFVNMDDDRWRSVMDVNLRSVLRMNDAILGEGGLSEGGRIVCVASIAGIAGNRGQTNYGASKAGVIGLVTSLSRQVADRGITVNAVAPGFIETEMTARIPFATREIGRRMNSLQQGGHPKDVAETIAWLAQPGAAAVTGQVVRVCGQSLLGA